MLRRLSIRPSLPGSVQNRSNAISRAIRPLSEMLESRVLLSLTLPAGFTQTTVASGFGEPTDMVPGTGGRYYITEKTGAVRVVDNGVLQRTPFTSIAVDSYRDRGLDAIALDPNFAANGFVYVYYTKADPSNPNTAPNGAVNRVTRFTANPQNPNIAISGSEVVLLDNIPSNTGYHIGGFFDFGRDGKLYLGTGDGGVPFDSQTSGVASFAQSLSSLGGKILRINSDGTIPSDNPFVNVVGDRGEIWAYGLRNPYSGGIDPTTGQIFANDVGQASWEEVNAITKGGNFGWPNAEGNSTNPAYINPVYTYAHDPKQLYSAAVTGGAFYRGTALPASFQGKYFFSDYIQGWIKTIDPVTGAVSPFATGANGTIRLETSSDGGILVLSHNDSAIYKVSYTGSAARPPVAAMSVSTTSGLAPLTVNFDGSASVDPDNHPLSYAWNFGDGATGAGVTATHQYTTNGRYTAVLTVTDSVGLSSTASSPVITVGSTAPVPTITTPITNTLYVAGDTITYAGTATDIQDGTLPASAFLWSIEFHHQTHTHTFIPGVAGVTSGSFVIPTDGETDAVQWYRIVLTVTDSAGLQGSSYVDVLPRKSNLTLSSNVPGATLLLDGQPVVSPSSTLAVAGLVRGLGAPSQQTVQEVNYGFTSWSDGGARNHTIQTPTTDTTYVASYTNLNQNIAFSSTPVSLPGILQAANFDTGGEGVAYHDISTTNDGNATYRPYAGVDLENSGDAVSPYNVGWMNVGEWLKYSVNVTATASYDLHARFAASGAGGTFHLNLDGAPITGTIAVPDTGGWQTYRSVDVTGVLLPAGQHVLQLVVDSGGSTPFLGNLASLAFSTALAGSPVVVPGTIEAESYDLGGEGIAYHDLDPANQGGAFRNDGVDIEPTGDVGGGFNVGYMQTGEWLNYTFTVPTAGTYVISPRVAAVGTGGMFHVDVDGTLVGSSSAFPDTGGWQTYQTVSLPAASLTAGTHVLRFSIDAVGTSSFAGNLNNLQITSLSTLPSAPIGLKAAVVSSKQVNLSWINASATPTGVKIERKIGFSGTYVEIGLASVGASAFSDSAASSSTQYYYRVRATNSAGDSPYSAEVTATTFTDSGQTSYLKNLPAIPGTIQAENFDNGADGISYHDTTSANLGGRLRNSGVDVERCGDSGGGYDVGYTAAGEWLEYTVKVGTTGWYAVDARVASTDPGGTFHVEFDGVNQTGSLTVPNTGGTQSYQTVSKNGIYLQAGTHVMRLALDTAGPGGTVGRFNWLKLNSAAAPAVAMVLRSSRTSFSTLAATVAPSVTSLTLINADTDLPIASFDPLIGGVTLNLATLPTRNLNIRANPGSGVSSVKFSYDAISNWRVENALPYSFFGDSAGNYNPWTPATGSHTVTVTPYSSPGATGTAGAALSVSFTVIDQAQTLPSVSIVATAPNAAEYPTIVPGTFTITRSGSTAQALTVSLSISGTATNGLDYSSLASSLVIPAGAASAILTVNPIDDLAVDGNETVIATLAAGTGYGISSSGGSAIVTIADSRVSPMSTPFFGTPATLPGTIGAEDFDNGGEGIAYHDSTLGNQGGSYRSTDVDIEPSFDTGGGYNIGHITTGEWLQYAVYIPVAGIYDVAVRVASATQGGSFRLLLDGADITGSLALPNTGGWQAWQNVSKLGVSLPSGAHVLRLVFEGPSGAEYGNVNSISITSPNTTTQTAVFKWVPIAQSPILRGEANSAVVNGKLYAFGGFINTLYQATTRSDVYDPGTNSWTRIADMPEALTHTANIVDGTIVWFIGGFIGNHPGPQTSHVWKYDTVAQTWSAGPALPYALGAGAAAVFNRQIHFFGGLLRDGNGLPTANTNEHWLLNLDGGTDWTSAANLPRARNHLAGVTLNGKIYAIGGQNLEDESGGNSAAVDVYDPATNAWQSGPDLPVARGHINPSTFVANGRILVIGGTKNGDIPMSDVTEFDPISNQWLALLPLPQGTKSPVAGLIGNTLIVSGGDNPNPSNGGWSAVLNNTWETEAPLPVSIGEVAGGVIAGKLYVVGEGTNATLSYNLANNTWSAQNALAVRPYIGNHHGAEVLDGKLYLIGGLGGGSEGRVQIYTPATNTWRTGASMPFAGGSVATALIGGKIYAAGGIVGSNTTAQAAVYDPVTNAWAPIAAMPLGVNHAAASTDGSKFYVIGGRDGGNVPSNGFNAVQIYNPVTNTWSSSTQSGSALSPLPQARGGTGKGVYLNGEFYVMGGETATGAGATSANVYKRVDIYNPITNTWRLGSPMITARHGIFPVLFAGRIYLAGGGVRSGDSTSTILEVYNAG